MAEDADQPITLRFDGRPVAAFVGDSVGAALTRAGVRFWRTTRHKARPRGLFCGIGVCYDCLLTVDGLANQRACLLPAADGMELRSGSDLRASGREGARSCVAPERANNALPFASEEATKELQRPTGREQEDPDR